MRRKKSFMTPKKLIFDEIDTHNQRIILKVIEIQAIEYIRTMVLILYGNSDIGAHVRSKVCCWICLRHMVRSKAVTNLIFLPAKKTIFLHTYTTYSKSPSTMIRVGCKKFGFSLGLIDRSENGVEFESI